MREGERPTVLRSGPPLASDECSCPGEGGAIAPNHLIVCVRLLFRQMDLRRSAATRFGLFGLLRRATAARFGLLGLLRRAAATGLGLFGLAVLRQTNVRIVVFWFARLFGLFRLLGCVGIVGGLVAAVVAIGGCGGLDHLVDVEVERVPSGEILHGLEQVEVSREGLLETRPSSCGWGQFAQFCVGFGLHGVEVFEGVLTFFQLLVSGFELEGLEASRVFRLVQLLEDDDHLRRLSHIIHALHVGAILFEHLVEGCRIGGVRQGQLFVALEQGAEGGKRPVARRIGCQDVIAAAAVSQLAVEVFELFRLLFKRLEQFVLLNNLEFSVFG